MKVSKLRARTSMRHLAGEDIPRADTTSFGMRNALKKAKRASGGVCMGEVDGEPKRAPLNKAVMRRNCGGRIGKWEGGETDNSPPNPGEASDDAQRKYLRKKSETHRDRAQEAALSSAGTGVMRAMARGAPKLLKWPLNAITGATAVGAGLETSAAKQASREADAFEPKDRKRGGKVGKDEGGGVGARGPRDVLSGDSQREAARLRKEASTTRDAAPAGLLGVGIPSVIGGALLHGLSKGRLGRGAAKAVGYGGVGVGTAAGAGLFHDANTKDAEASRIEKGLAKPGEEDRKRGGKVGKKS